MSSTNSVSLGDVEKTSVVPERQAATDTPQVSGPKLSDHRLRPACTKCTTTPQTDPGPPPDGGTQAWLQVLAGHFVNALTWGYVTSYGVFQTYYVAHLGHNASDISWIGSIQIFLLLFIGTFSGRATDAGLARTTVAIGSLFLIFGTFMTSLATTYWQIFLAQGLCVGIGMGTVYMPSLTLIGTYFSRKRAFAVGIAAAGSGTGGLVFPTVVQYLIPKIGFGWAVRCMAFIALAFAIIFNVLLKTRLPPRKLGPVVEWPAFKEAPYTLFTLGMFLIFWALYFAFYYVDTFGRDFIGLNDTETVIVLLIMNGVGIPSRLVLGLAADKWFGPVNTLIPVAGTVGMMLYCWIAVHNRGGLYAFATVYGVFAASTQSLFAGALASLTDDLSKTGTRMGMVFTVMSFASLTGAPIAGAIIERGGGSYLGAQVWAGTAVLAGCLTLAAARGCKTGWKWKRKM